MLEAREVFDERLPESIYYADPWYHPSPPRQIRESLQRSRRLKIGFPLAWKIATRHLQHDHDFESRHEWKAVLADDVVIRTWEAAYERRSDLLLDGVSLLAQALDDAEERDARVRHPHGPHPD